MNMLIDSHHHLWNYSAEQYGWINEEMEVLRRNFGTADLKQISDENGVNAFVSVQARQSLEETDALLDLARDAPLIQGVVGWVPLCAADLDATLDRYSQMPVLKGVRHVVQDEPDDRFLLRDDFNRGIRMLANRNLVYDVLIYGRQLPAAIEFVEMHPDQPMVLDHIAKPTIKKDLFDKDWQTGFLELARRDNLCCKFSGVVTEIVDEQWDIETVRPYWETALEAFTPKRLMFGSDWPVCLLRSEYSRWLEMVQELASELSSDEQQDFFFNNAIRAYQLDANTAS